VISSGVTAQTGNAFFAELVRSLCTALKAHLTFVSQIDTQKYEADILAIWVGGAFGKPEPFNLAGTPCESVLDGNIACFPSRVRDLFPAARPYLDGAGIKSYLAIPLVDEDARVIGHIAVQDQRERDWNETDFGLLRLFASRAAAELKRRNHELALEGANNQLQRANASLRREVAKRLEMEGELAQAKQAAEEAQCLAESASQAKSKFLAHMSHELRTPLNGILGYAQLLKRSASLSGTDRDSIGVIEHSGEHLLTLINDLLDLAKVEAGRLDLHASGFELPLLLKQVADLIAVRATQAGLEFRSDIGPDLPLHVRADERALRQVLLNLLGNAVKFTEAGSVEFRATAVGAGNGTRRVRFEVRDTGVGIAPEDRARIFEPFDRGSAGGNRRVEGTGLGLAITRRLLDAMGGTIDVTDAPGHGSVFTVELDLEYSSLENAASASKKAEPPRRETAPPADVRVSGRFVTELYDLAMKGDVKELLARADAAIDGDPDGTPVYSEVRRLARSYDMKGVRRALQRAREVHG
jgi:signal transduction histidine kinase